jgi:molybdopterin-guanine dinucleotide biosynthesis protein A
LHGLSAALSDFPEPAEFAYLAAVDAPRFAPEWLRLLLDRIGDGDAAAAIVAGHAQPFAALYRVGPTRDAVARRLAEGTPRLVSLLDVLATRWLREHDFATVDPSGDLFRDLDRPRDYRRALAEMEMEGRTPARFEMEEGPPGTSPSDPRVSRSSEGDPSVSEPSR